MGPVGGPSGGRRQMDLAERVEREREGQRATCGNSMCVRVDVVSPARPASGARPFSPSAAAAAVVVDTLSTAAWPPPIDNDLPASAAPAAAATRALPGRLVFQPAPPPARGRPSAPFVRRRRRRGASGLHSLCRSLIQSRLDFSRASGIVPHAMRASCVRTVRRRRRRLSATARAARQIVQRHGDRQ